MSLKGTINKGLGNYYVLSIYSLPSLYAFAKLVNGKFRTNNPKLEALHRLIAWLNEKGNFKYLDLKPLDESYLSTNSWFAEFADCDSNFSYFI